jgi:endonuclease YncB( thermonuclease family)
MAAALAPQARGGDLAGRASVVDVDAIEVHVVRIRLFGADAPEGLQTCRDDANREYRCGQTATEALAKLLVAKPSRSLSVRHGW